MSLMSRLAPLSLLLLPSLPAQAQETPPGPLCSGQPAGWLGDSPDASDITAADAALSQQMTTTADTSPYAMFRVTDTMQHLRLEAMSDGDPSIRLETPEGDLLAENDDAVGLNARIEQSVGPFPHGAIDKPRVGTYEQSKWAFPCSSSILKVDRGHPDDGVAPLASLNTPCIQGRRSARPAISL